VDSMSLRMSSVLLCRIGLREEDERDSGKPDAALRNLQQFDAPPV
jgi:hypothetical protein